MRNVYDPYVNLRNCKLLLESIPLEPQKTTSIFAGFWTHLFLYCLYNLVDGQGYWIQITIRGCFPAQTFPGCPVAASTFLTSPSSPSKRPARAIKYACVNWFYITLFWEITCLRGDYKNDSTCKSWPLRLDNMYVCFLLLYGPSEVTGRKKFPGCFAHLQHAIKARLYTVSCRSTLHARSLPAKPSWIYFQWFPIYARCILLPFQKSSPQAISTVSCPSTLHARSHQAHLRCFASRLVCFATRVKWQSANKRHARWWQYFSRELCPMHVPSRSAWEPLDKSWAHNFSRQWRWWNLP